MKKIKTINELDGSEPCPVWLIKHFSVKKKKKKVRFPGNWHATFSIVQEKKTSIVS